MLSFELLISSPAMKPKIIEYRKILARLVNLKKSDKFNDWK